VHEKAVEYLEDKGGDRVNRIPASIADTGLEDNRPLAKKICVILKSLLKFRSNFELLGDWHLLKLAQPARL
jgi:hypothetical protein